MAVTEKQVAYQVRRLYEAVGCTVYSTSQARPSRVAKGLPDLYVVHPRIGGWWHEVKREGGRQSPGQVAFQQEMQRCGVAYVLGGLAEAQAFLHTKGIVVNYGSLPGGVSWVAANFRASCAISVRH